MIGTQEEERIETVVVGGGQAGLSVGYHLARLGIPFVIVDVSEHMGDAWRKRGRGSWPRPCEPSR